MCVRGCAGDNMVFGGSECHTQQPAGGRGAEDAEDLTKVQLITFQCEDAMMSI